MRICIHILVLTSLLVGVCACNTVKPYEKERLTDRTMTFDYDPATSILRADIITTRTASIGGFTSAAAGGCSCK